MNIGIITETVPPVFAATHSPLRTQQRETPPTVCSLFLPTRPNAPVLYIFLPPQETMPPTVFCYHPHGVFSQSYILNGSLNKELPRQVGLLASEGLCVVHRFGLGRTRARLAFVRCYLFVVLVVLHTHVVRMNVKPRDGTRNGCTQSAVRLLSVSRRTAGPWSCVSGKLFANRSVVQRR